MPIRQLSKIYEYNLHVGLKELQIRRPDSAEKI
jgi:hypothetical protein